MLLHVIFSRWDSHMRNSRLQPCFWSTLLCLTVLLCTASWLSSVAAANHKARVLLCAATVGAWVAPIAVSMGAEQSGHVFLHCVSHFEMQAGWKAWEHGNLTTIALGSSSARQTRHSVALQSLACIRGRRSTRFLCAVFRFGNRSSNLLSFSKSSGLRSRYINSITSSWNSPHGRIMS